MKSNVSHCCADTIAVLIDDGRCIKSLFCQEVGGAVKACTDNKALDGLARYADTSTNIPIGSSLMWVTVLSVLLRLLVCIEDIIG